MSVGRPSRSSVALAVAAPGTVVVVAAVVLTVRRIHTGSADQQDLTATVVAGDLAAVALAVTLLGLLWAGVRRARAGAAARAALLEADAVGTHLGRWPRLGRASLETLGVREPRTSAGRRRAQLPYVPRRTSDRRLRDALGGHWFVLVHGPAAVGKSRSVAETCAALFGDRPVVAPAVRDGALSRLLDADVIPAGAVVWLDDLDRHLQAGVDATVLQRIRRRPGQRVVATMRAAAYEQLKPSGDIRPPGRDVVDLAEQVEYPNWDAADRADAARQVVDRPDVVEALNRGMGLGEYLSAGPELIDRLEAGSPPAGGVAVVRAAADWYRAGLTRPAPLDLVRRLYRHYLPDDDATLLRRFDESVRWATTPVSGARLVVNRTDGSGLAVHDYVLDHLAAVLPPGLPAATWTALADHLHDSPADLDSVGLAADLTHHDPTAATRFLRAAADAGHAGAMSNLGVLLHRLGEPVEAERRLRAGGAAGHAGAMANLGVLLDKQGEPVEAERWYRAAIDTGPPGHITAMYNLGGLLNDRGEPLEAERCWRAAAATGHPDAMYNLGLVLTDRGELVEGERWYRAAIDTGHPGAMSNLGVLLNGRGEVVEAERCWRAAAATGHPDAMSNLGVLSTDRGDLVEAERWYRAAVEAGKVAATADLGILSFQRGELVEAVGWWLAGADAGDTSSAANLRILRDLLGAARVAGPARRAGPAR